MRRCEDEVELRVALERRLLWAWRTSRLEVLRSADHLHAPWERRSGHAASCEKQGAVSNILLLPCPSPSSGDRDS